MRGFPKQIATKQDYLNLLAMPEYRAAALAELKALLELDDDTVIALKERKIGDLHEVRETVEQPNPFPQWRQKGFQSKEEVKKFIAAAGGGAFPKGEREE